MSDNHTRPDIPAIVTTDFSPNDDNNGEQGPSGGADATQESPRLETSRLETPIQDATESPTADTIPFTPATPSPVTPGHARSPSDPAFLGPTPWVPTDRERAGSSSPGRPSFDAASSTYAPSIASSVPPSPASSVHFSTSVDLRRNEPGAGLTSLDLLKAQKDGHGRKGSIASYRTTESTEPDHAHLGLAPVSTNAKSDTTSITAASPTDADVNSLKGKKKRRKGADSDEKEQEKEPAHLDPVEADKHIDPTPFDFKPFALASLVDPKSVPSLTDMGGIDGLLRGLGSDPKRGLHPAHIGGPIGDESGSQPPPPSVDPEKGGAAFGASKEDRLRVFGGNELPVRKSKGLLLLMWIAFKDKIMLLLSLAALVSLVLGLVHDYGPSSNTVEGPKVDFVEGIAIMIAVGIVVIVGAVNDWQKEQQFKKLNEKKDDRYVKVLRGGSECQINIKDVLVGDIALLEPGEIIPCDGVFLKGHNVRCDESTATGETDAIKKVPYNQAKDIPEGRHTDCFLISGSKVVEGYGSYVVIAVGKKSFHGRIMMAVGGDTEATPLQDKLNALAELIAKIGSIAGAVLFGALLIKFFVQLKTKPGRSATTIGFNFLDIVIISVSLIVVAVPEGLPLAVTLALAFATKRMVKERLLVRVLGSCETMANASVVCTDKTGTLTQNEMTVVAGSIGIHAKFVRNLQENLARSNAPDGKGENPTVEGDVKAKPEDAHRKFPDDFSVDLSNLNGRVLNEGVQRLFHESITINSTAFEDTNPETGQKEFVGSKTETALLKFNNDLDWGNYKHTRESANVVQMIPFSSERKAMGVVARIGDRKWRLYLKGASEILTKLCQDHIVIRSGKAGDVGSSTEDGKDEILIKAIDSSASDNISRTIIFYANQTLRTIALCYRDFDSWPPPYVSTPEKDEVPYEEIAKDLTLIGIVGIEDPLRPGVREAVANCIKAGVSVKMCTGDNVLTARSIALQCGIFSAGGIIMEGPVFRTLNDAEMLDVVPRLQVLARSSPEDKNILVNKLKEIGEIVGVTGDGTNDGPALSSAHVGFSMGIAGTEVAKEASDIILMDDNFASIVSAIMWGRCVNDAVRKFLQFQISVNITAVVITFVTAVASDDETSALTAVQLLWINIIMDTFAALALATDPASPELLNRKPEKKTAPLFTVDMYKQIFGQAIYQIIVILVFHFAGSRIFGYEHESDDVKVGHEAILQTMVFNAFVFAQIFNSFNSRSITQDKNIFAGVFRNYYFMGITLLEFAIQILVIFVGGAAFSVKRLPGREWGISLALGFMSLPIGFLIRLVPNPPVERAFIKIRLLPDPNALPTTSPATSSEWNSAITLVRDNLNTFANVRGGRLRSSSIVLKSRSQRLDRAGVQLPSLLTMIPTLVASSVGAGWKPQEGSLSDPAQGDPSRSSAALWEGKVQIHPETQHDDPAYVRWGNRSPA